MIEILTMGNVEGNFNRLGVKKRQTYNSDEYGVCEVTNEEFEKLCNDSNEDAWVDCGWRYCKGSNQDIPNQNIKIKGKELIAWYDDTYDFDSEEEKESYLEEHNGVIPMEEYKDLLTYLCDEKGCSQPRNVCALTKDLAKYNNMKLSELFKIYQG